MNEENDLVVTRVVNAPVEKVWEAWTNPELVMQWWAPDHFTSPSADIHFAVGEKSVVCMHAPPDFGGQDTYTAWEYKKIVPNETIQFINNLSDKDGNTIDPTSIGMPADFPRDMLMTASFKSMGDTTEMTVTQHGWTPGQMRTMGEMGLNQSLTKLQNLFA